MEKNQFTSLAAPWITTVFFVLAFYGLGAGMMDSFAMYHSWKFIGTNEFARAHVEAGHRIILCLVVPMMLMTVFLILQFWHRHRAIQRSWLWTSLVCTIICWLSSAFIQIPIQAKLSLGKDEGLLEWLIVSDWIRIVPTWFMMGFVIKMVHACITK